MRSIRSTLITGALLAGFATDGEAQHPQVRNGFWVGFGLGYGDAWVSCDGCVSSDNGNGVSIYFKIGGTLSRKVLLGGEINALATDNSLGIPGSGTTSTALGNLSAAVYYYPAVNAGFFVKGGAGFSSITQTNDLLTLDGSGWGLLAGLGYDLRVGRNVSLTPFANFYFGQPGNLTSGNTTVVTGFSQRVFDLGLGITFH